MSKVKFNVNSEYMYIQNFKVLQSKSAGPIMSPTNQPDTFARHNIDKTVSIESLVKCKMQDNLEFLQFTKRYWDQCYPGGEYDAVARRKGNGAMPSGAPARMAMGGGAGGGAARRGPGAGSNTMAPRTRTPQGGGGAASAALQQENAALRETIAGLQRETDFYFRKLRDIELLIQQAIEADPELDKEDDGLLKQIQAILYSTEVCRCAAADSRAFSFANKGPGGLRDPDRRRGGARCCGGGGDILGGFGAWIE
jgi:RP/EB family microtubule-associated protein